jgi:hypothetical protein
MPAVIRPVALPTLLLWLLLAVPATALAQSRNPMNPPEPPPAPLPSTEDRGEDDDGWKGDDVPEDERPTGLLQDGFLREFDGEW